MMLKRCLMLFCISVLIVLCGCDNGAENSSNKHSEVKSAVKFSDAPEEYRELLSDYENIVDFRFSKDFENEYNNGKFIELRSTLKEELDSHTEESAHWYDMLVEMPYGRKFNSKDSFGYILKDINNDGVLELFWVNEDHFTLAVFTVKDGKAHLLDAFWPRYSCVVTDSGLLYTAGSGGASVTQFTIRELNENSEFNTLVQFGTDGVDDNNLDVFYKVKDGTKNNITEKQFEELLSAYPFENGKTFEETPITPID